MTMLTLLVEFELSYCFLSRRRLRIRRMIGSCIIAVIARVRRVGQIMIVKLAGNAGQGLTPRLGRGWGCEVCAICAAKW